ncbi:hypothetical protein CCP3SC1_1240002 [Gammaproteobacteria bacterium]
MRLDFFVKPIIINLIDLSVGFCDKLLQIMTNLTQVAACTWLMGFCQGAYGRMRSRPH